MEMKYKEERYPSDCEIATVQFVKIILPNLVAKRQQMMRTLTELEGSYENTELLGILHTLDGEYPFTELIMARLINWATDNKIEFYKYAGGCSLWQQFLDMCKCFWHWREKMSVPPLTENPYYPPWALVLKKRFEAHGMDKASVKLYIWIIIFYEFRYIFQTSFRSLTSARGL